MAYQKTTISDREKQILELIKEKGSAAIQELADSLSVSTMTVHRDLNRLEEMGYIRKRHGEATLATDSSRENSCAMCRKPISGKNTFIVHLTNGEQKTACCAHCGLMLLIVTKDAWQSMTADFLHNHMISANQAVYLIGCGLNICCVPTILAFGSHPEASRFQTGFGGTLASMDEAIKHLMEMGHNHQ